eukprot:scpid66313/ scgid13057/ 
MTLYSDSLQFAQYSGRLLNNYYFEVLKLRFVGDLHVDLCEQQTMLAGCSSNTQDLLVERMEGACRQSECEISNVEFTHFISWLNYFSLKRNDRYNVAYSVAPAVIS